MAFRPLQLPYHPAPVAGQAALSATDQRQGCWTADRPDPVQTLLAPGHGSGLGLPPVFELSSVPAMHFAIVQLQACLLHLVNRSQLCLGYPGAVFACSFVMTSVLEHETFDMATKPSVQAHHVLKQ